MFKLIDINVVIKKAKTDAVTNKVYLASNPRHENCKFTESFHRWRSILTHLSVKRWRCLS